MILTVCNHKGGVAKTTTAYYLARLIARAGIRPLLIDLDPQANLTRMCRISAPLHTVSDIIGGAHAPTSTLSDARICITLEPPRDLGHVIPSSIALENTAVGLMSRDFGRLTALRSALEGEKSAPITIIDTPPNAGILTLNALVASTHMLICANPETDAIAGVQRMVEIVEQIKQERGTAPAILGVLATQTEPLIVAHRKGITALNGNDMPPLIGQIPKRKGLDADEKLLDSYAPVAGQILSEAGLEVRNARFAT